MQFGTFNYPVPVNEPVLSYATGSKEKLALKEAIVSLKKKALDIPMIIGGKEIRTDIKKAIHPPHEIKHTLGYFHMGNKKQVDQAISAGLKVRNAWSNMNWEARAHIFLKAGQIRCGRKVLWCIVSAGILKVCATQAEFLCTKIHQFHEGGFVACNVCG
jgi:1-pyrroline-5-carboxylate dehydrogenase